MQPREYTEVRDDIKAHGIQVPLDISGNTVLDGRHRLMIARELGLRTIPCRPVSLDGESLTMLQFGDEYTCEVKAGPHRLKAHNTLFWKTRQIVLRPGEHARFTAINRKGPISFGLLFMLGAFPLYLTFERDVEVPVTGTLLRRHAGG